MNEKKVVLLSHCLLNNNSKVENFNNNNEEFEEKKRKLIVGLIEKNVGIIQLPCPELQMYGCRRWGHVKEQFDTPHFRETSRKLLSPIIRDLIDYKNNNVEILGVLGVNGSPSCGISFTCCGQWYGEFSHNDNLQKMLSTLSIKPESGVFMEELKRSLEENNISIPMIGIDRDNVEKIFPLLKLDK